MNDFDDTTLTEAEELRFEELFSPSDRLSLTHDWKQTLREVIPTEGSALFDTTTEGGEGSADVINLDERRGLRALAPRLLIAAAFVAIVGFGIAARGGSSSNEVVNAPVLAPELEIGTPTFSRLELPDSVVFTNTIDGGIVAISQDPDTEESTLFSTTDGVTWIQGETLPVRNAVVDAAGSSWVIAGEEIATLAPLTNAPGESIATNVAVYRSLDAGISWEPLEYSPEREDQEKYFSVKMSDVAVTQLDDKVLVSHVSEVVFDSTAFMVDNGVVGPDDRVVEVHDDNFSRVFFSLGPDVAGALNVDPSDLGMTQAEYDRIVGSPLWIDEHLALSAGGQTFESVPLPTDFGVGAPLIDSQNGEFLWANVRITAGTVVPSAPGGSVDLSVYRSEDGRSWDRLDLDDLYIEEVISESWILREESERLEQSLDARRRFDLVPVPQSGVIAMGVVPTDFGVAVAWLDLDRILTLPEATTIVEGDYTIVFEGDGVRVTDSSGVEVGTQSVPGIPEGPVVVTPEGRVFVLGDDGELVVSTSDVPADVTAFFGDEAPDHMISWSTDGTDWKFASLDGIGPGLWDYYSTEAGLIAIETFDYEDAVVFDWPEEFVDR